MARNQNAYCTLPDVLYMICMIIQFLCIPSWIGVFQEDSACGISHYQWAVGSSPGHSDVMTFTSTQSQMGSSEQVAPLDLRDGHSYYVSVKVRIYRNIFMY